MIPPFSRSMHAPDRLRPAHFKSSHPPTIEFFWPLIIPNASSALAPHAGLCLGAPRLSSLGPTAQSDGRIRPGRGGVGRSSCGVHAACFAASRNVVALVQGRWQRSSRLPLQGRVRWALGGRRSRGPRADRSHGFSGDGPAILTTRRGVAGPANLLFERAFVARRVGGRAGVAAVPLSLLRASRDRLVRRLRAGFVCQGRRTAHARRPSVVDGQALARRPGLINVPSCLSKGAFTVKRAPLAGDELTAGFLGHSARAQCPLGRLGRVGGAGAGLDVGDSSY